MRRVCATGIVVSMCSLDREDWGINIKKVYRIYMGSVGRDAAQEQDAETAGKGETAR